MNETLRQLRDDIGERRQHEMERRLREYRQEMEPTVSALKHAAAELAKIAPKINPIIEEALKNYPFNLDDPPSVKKEIGFLRDRCESLQRHLKDKPGEIEKLLEKIANRQPADFVSVTVATRLGIDNR